jgi:hypothetical protein
MLEAEGEVSEPRLKQGRSRRRDDAQRDPRTRPVEWASTDTRPAHRRSEPDEMFRQDIIRFESKFLLSLFAAAVR